MACTTSHGGFFFAAIFHKYGVAVKVPTLLSQADGVFGHFLAEITHMLFDRDTAKALFRLFLTGLAALVTFGYLYSLFAPRQLAVAKRYLQ